MAPRDALEERPVEAHVVGDDVAPPYKVEQPRHDALDARLPCDHLAGDPGELGDLEWHGHERVDERVERRNDLRPPHDRGRDLDDMVAIAVVPGRLDVDDRDLILEAEQRCAGTLGERLVRRDDVGIGTRDKKAMQGLKSHPPRVADAADISVPLSRPPGN